MTDKPTSDREQPAAEEQQHVAEDEPRLTKETIKDLAPEEESADDVKGGRPWAY